MKFALFLVLSLAACAPSPLEKTTYSFDRISFAYKPVQIPSAIPRAFLPDEVQFDRSIELKSGFLNSKEAYLVLSSKTPASQIVKDIEARSKFGDWKIIERSNTEGENHLLLEGFLKKYLSIFVYEKGDSRIVKYFFKKNSGY